MELSELSDDQKLKLYEHVRTKFDWAGKKNIIRLAKQELNLGKIIL